MKVLFLSFVVGLGVGALYGLIRVKSPAPPIVALLGLLGMVLGEQLGVGFLQRSSMFPMLRPFALWVSLRIRETDSSQTVVSVQRTRTEKLVLNRPSGYHEPRSASVKGGIEFVSSGNWLLWRVIAIAVLFEYVRWF